MLGVGDIDGAAAIHGDSGGVANASILERKQRRALGFKLMNEIAGRVHEKYIPQEIRGKRGRLIQLARPRALIVPGSDKFKRRRLRFRRGVGALTAGDDGRGRGRKKQGKPEATEGNPRWIPERFAGSVFEIHSDE